MSNPFSGNKNVEHPCLLDVVHGLFVRHHREVVPIELQDLVIDQKPGLARRTVGGDLRNVDSVVRVTLTKLMVNECSLFFLRLYLPEDFSCNPDLSRLQF